MKPKIILLILLIFHVCLSFSQNQKKIDSLEVLLKGAKHDTTRMTLLNKLAEEYDRIILNKAIEFSSQALKIGEQHLLNGKGKVSVKVDKSIKKELSHSFYIIATIYKDQGKYDLALKNFNQSLNYGLKIDDKKRIAFNYNGIGVIYKEQGKYEEAIKMHFKSLEIKKTIGDKRGISNSYNNIGMIYERQGNYADALKMHYESLKIKKQIGYKIGIADSYMNIAIICRHQKNYNEALEYDFQAMRIILENKDNPRLIRVYNDIGVFYKEQNKFIDALEYYTKALKLAEANGYKHSIVLAKTNIGNIYRDIKKENEAEIFYLSALKLCEEIGDNEGMTYIFNNLGDLYFQQKKYYASIEHYNKSLRLCKLIGRKEGIKWSLQGLSKGYQKLGNYQKAYDNQLLFSQLSDSLLNEENLKQINEMKAKYEYEKKEKEIELLNKDRKIQETIFKAKLKQETIVRNVFIGGFLLVLLIAFLFILWYRQKIRTNTIIAIKNEQISRQQANILGKEDERKRIAKELHDGLGGTLAAIKLNLIRIHSSTRNVDDLESVIENVGDACKEIRSISHDLAPIGLSNTSLIDGINDVIQKFIIPEKLNIHFEYFPLDELNQLSGNIQIDIYRIIQELLNNIVKHANASEVEIYFSKEENDLHLLVEDNGIGFDITTLKKGIGLNNIESRINALHGEVIIDSKAGRGTAVNINIPLPLVVTNNTSI